jgi:hypothetical protein
MTRLSESLRAYLQRIFTVIMIGALAASLVAAQTGFDNHRSENQDQKTNSVQPAFTYQGQLKDGSLPANGTYDLQFTLHTVQTGGEALGTLVSQRLLINNGLFKVELDFGGVVAAGRDHWLEVAVRPSDGGEAYAVLSPRQKLTSTPYAIFAQQERWGLIGVPVGYAGDLEMATVSGDKAEDPKVGEPAIKSDDSTKREATAAMTATVAADSLANTNFIAKFDAAGNATLKSSMYDNGTGVGIGSLSPTAPLHIEGLNDQQFRIVDRKTSGRNWAFATGHNTLGDFVFLDATANKNVWRVMPGVSGPFVIEQRAVGIGITNPTNMLSVAGGGDFSGNLGIGTAAIPTAKLHIENGAGESMLRIVDKRTAGRNWLFATGHNNPGDFVFLDVTGNANVWRVMPGNNGAYVIDNRRVGIGTATPETQLHVAGAGDQSITVSSTDSLASQTRLIAVTSNGRTESQLQFRSRFSLVAPLAGQALMSILENGNVGVGTADPQAKLDIRGMTRTDILQITGGSDLAEPFEVSAAETIKPGLVMAIDPRRPGQLRLANRAYDRTVAGIVSGANGINPGLTMKQQGSVADGSLPVALSGRVYCWVDASYGPITPGDLLTTSKTPGHAMKAANHSKAEGAVIGKAMTELKRGKGLVLVLVSLQ